MGLKLLRRPENPISDARFRMDTGELKTRSVRSGAITLIDQGSATLIHTVSVIVLARLLTPEDYGIVAMVTAVTGFLELFRELGLSSATVRIRSGATREKRRMLATGPKDVTPGASSMTVRGSLRPMTEETMAASTSPAARSRAS